MTARPQDILIFHITDISNLAGITASGLLSDKAMIRRGDHSVIGYDHIKRRRMEEIQVDCCGYRYVGEFVPFYFCPRSPMLYTINMGNTGRAPGCQEGIVHLVSTVGSGISLNRDWAFSDGNAGAFHTSFFSDINKLSNLDWQAINAKYWSERRHQKQSEFLIADYFPWQNVSLIACHNVQTAALANDIISRLPHRPEVRVKRDWYF